MYVLWTVLFAVCFSVCPYIQDVKAAASSFFQKLQPLVAEADSATLSSIAARWVWVVTSICRAFFTRVCSYSPLQPI